jgi:glutaredoxin
MAKFKIVTKKDCFFCDKLKQWLEEKDVDWIEIDYLDPKNKDDPLMKNPTFYTIYCDMSACVESLPIVVKDDKEFYYGEIWDLKNNEIVEYKASKIFEI